MTVLLAACSHASSDVPMAAARPQTGSAAKWARFDTNLLSRQGVPSVALPEPQRILRPAPVRRAKPYPGGAIDTAQYYGNDVKIYGVHKEQLKLKSSLTDGISHPQGLATSVDLPREAAAARPLMTRTSARPDWSSTGVLYIANTGASNVLAYLSTPSGPEGPVAVLNDPGQYPVDVDISLGHQFVAVSNAFTTTFASGTVSIYQSSASSPQRTLTVPDFVEGVGVAIDSHGDCYWSVNNFGNFSGQILKFSNCQEPATSVTTALNVAGGIAFDGNDNLYYVDQMSGVYKCVKTADCALLSGAFGDPVFINFDKQFANLWVADASGYIDAVDPSTGSIVSSTQATAGNSDPPIGVGVAPAPRR